MCAYSMKLGLASAAVILGLALGDSTAAVASPLLGGVGNSILAASEARVTPVISNRRANRINKRKARKAAKQSSGSQSSGGLINPFE